MRRARRETLPSIMAACSQQNFSTVSTYNNQATSPLCSQKDQGKGKRRPLEKNSSFRKEKIPWIWGSLSGLWWSSTSQLHNALQIQCTSQDRTTLTSCFKFQESSEMEGNCFQVASRISWNGKYLFSGTFHFVRFLKLKKFIMLGKEPMFWSSWIYCHWPGS